MRLLRRGSMWVGGIPINKMCSASMFRVETSAQPEHTWGSRNWGTFDNVSCSRPCVHQLSTFTGGTASPAGLAGWRCLSNSPRMTSMDFCASGGWFSRIFARTDATAGPMLRS
jgi:hypothetical protein